MADKFFEVKDLEVKYGDIQVIWKESFYLDKGEIIAIVGSNGAGKSSTVGACCGLINPSGGSIKINGIEMTGQIPRKFIDQGIILVPEGRQLFPEMSVLENLEMGCSSKEARAKKKETLEKVYSWFPVLKERAKQMAGCLSGGEQQMVAFSRGMMQLPKLLIMDEPSLGLAPNIVDSIFEISRQISQETGLAIILVEQDVRKALKIANRGYVIENGHITIQGSSSELLNNPEIKKAYLGF
ncbi:MAG: ABC transporter ATP-binding protein [Eubacteriales bacterium]|nr:ABC transporter ATP-binding protein [Eubacteriales bacterium]